MEVHTPNHEIIIALSKAIRESKPMQIFYFYRLLETKKYQVRRSNVHSIFHVVDLDGNILEIIS